MTFEPTISSPRPENSPAEAPSPAPGYEMPPEPGAAIPEPQAAATGAVSPEPEPEMPAGWAREYPPMAEEVFFENFKGLVWTPNIYRSMKKQIPLKCLEIADDDLQARAASRALYETCLEIPWLNFMLAPENKYLQRLMVVGGFAFSTFRAAQVELALQQALVETVKKGLPEDGQADDGEPAPEKPPARPPDLKPVKPEDFGAMPEVPPGEPDDAAPPADDGSESVLEVANA